MHRLYFSFFPSFFLFLFPLSLSLLLLLFLFPSRVRRLKYLSNRVDFLLRTAFRLGLNGQSFALSNLITPTNRKFNGNCSKDLEVRRNRTERGASGILDWKSSWTVRSGVRFVEVVRRNWMFSSDRPSSIAVMRIQDKYPRKTDYKFKNYSQAITRNV